MYYGHQIIHSWGTDENGNDYEKDEAGKPEGEHSFYAYNEFGDMILQKTAEHTDTITYKYDDKGNWIEQFHSNISIPSILYLDENQLYGQHVKRVIEYYKSKNDTTTVEKVETLKGEENEKLTLQNNISYPIWNVWPIISDRVGKYIEIVYSYDTC